jgi:hypothetical protein
MTTGRINQVTTAAPGSGASAHASRARRETHESRPILRVPQAALRTAQQGVPQMPRACPPTQAPAWASARRDPFRGPFRIPPKCSTVRRPAHAEALAQRPGYLSAHDLAPSLEELPHPAVQLFSVPGPGVCDLVAL